MDPKVELVISQELYNPGTGEFPKLINTGDSALNRIEYNKSVC